jgi:drug/metabolite transporter (DMT)-like permease
MFFSLFSCVVTLPFMIASYHPMEWWQLGSLLLAGTAATGGQLCITAAYTKAPAKEISVFDYSQVLFAAIWGMLFLNQVPDVLSVIGYVIIIGTAVFKWRYNLTHENG